MSNSIVRVSGIRETFEGFSAVGLEELSNWPGSHLLPIAVAQLAIMCATPQGEWPDSIGNRLAAAEKDTSVVEGFEGFYDTVLNEEERGYVSAAEIVIGAIEARRKHGG